MYEVGVEVSFEATHAVQQPDGSWESPHAHRWRIVATFRGVALDDHGFLVDFVDVQRRLRQLVRPLENADLNAHPFLRGYAPSTEHLARRVFEELSVHDWRPGRLTRVQVHEAPGCWASFGTVDDPI